MKQPNTLLLAGALILSGSLRAFSGQSGQSLPADTVFHEVNRGANFKIYQRETYGLDALGNVKTNLHQYTALATGMHYRDAQGQWQESQEQINIQPDGTATATQGQFQVTFPADISQGVIQVVTRDGRQLQSCPSVICYDDGNNIVVIGTLKSSVGQVVGNNQAIYHDVFQGVSADLRYTYRRSGFEQDVVFQRQPPSPDQLGLNPQTTRLQILTEFVNTTDPVVTRTRFERHSQLTDQTLKFGKLKLIQGRAFTTKNEPGNRHLGGVPVYKSWVKVGRRTFLVEEVSLPQIADDLNNLQAYNGTHQRGADGVLYAASKVRLLPAWHPVTGSTNRMTLAKAVPHTSSPTLVMDYESLTGDTPGYTFKADTTYLIEDVFNTDDAPAVLEGGTVIKFNTAADNCSFQTWGGVDTQTGPYRPAVFTSQNDNSVGENLSVSGTPMNYGCALSLDQNPCVMSYVRICYSDHAFHPCFATHTLRNSQFVNCGSACYPEYDTLTLDNVLITGTPTAFDGTSYNLMGDQVTVNGASLLTSDYADPTYSSIALTNSLFVNIAATGDVALATNCVNWLPSGALQTVGGGNGYLANASPYRGAGTTNLDPAVLANLATKTTYPPLIYFVPGVILNNTNLTLITQAFRDTNTFPDLGYHYDPLDYIFGPIFTTNTSITVAPGVALGFFATNTYNYGLGLSDNSQFTSVGTPTSLNHIVECGTVQETSPAGWEIPNYGLLTHYSGSQPYTINCRFTDWSVMASDAAHIQLSDANSLSLSLRENQFHGGLLTSSYHILNLTNCLLERVNTSIDPNDTNTPAFLNNTFFGGTFDFEPSQTNAVIQNNLFDGTLIPVRRGHFGLAYYGGHNAFVTNNNTLNPLFTSDVVLSNSPAYQSSFLGNYYQPTNSPLINAGSLTADLVGLYHFTTQTSQVKETNSIVDIGYHYVATDMNGNPVDTDGDGIPDYLEDSNGNGLVDAGDLGNWLLSPYNGLSSTVVLSVFTPLK